MLPQCRTIAGDGRTGVQTRDAGPAACHVLPDRFLLDEIAESEALRAEPPSATTANDFWGDIMDMGLNVRWLRPPRSPHRLGGSANTGAITIRASPAVASANGFLHNF